MFKKKKITFISTTRIKLKVLQIPQTYTKASDYVLLFQQLLRMILKTDAGVTFMLKETEVLQKCWTDKNNINMHLFLALLHKKSVDYYCTFWSIV